jgi:hypothetical protein
MKVEDLSQFGKPLGSWTAGRKKNESRIDPESAASPAGRRGYRLRRCRSWGKVAPREEVAGGPQRAATPRSERPEFQVHLVHNPRTVEHSS